jgi:putative PIN family toxin of toxin-antitoxin system
LIWGGKPAQIVKAAEEGKVALAMSEEIVDEISQVLTYSKLKKVYQTEGLLHQDMIEALLKVSEFVKVTRKVNVVLEHPADDKFIDCALAAKADYIISGDKHLLKVGCYRKTQILSVNEFLKLIETK